MKKLLCYCLLLSMLSVGCSGGSSTIEEDYDIAPEDSFKVEVKEEDTVIYTFRNIERDDYPLIYSSLVSDINDVTGWVNTDFGANFSDFVTVDRVIDEMIEPDSYRILYNNGVLDCHLYVNDKDYLYQISQDMNIEYIDTSSHILSKDIFDSDEDFNAVSKYIDKYNINIDEPSVEDSKDNGIKIILNDYNDWLIVSNSEVSYVSFCDISSANKLEYNIMKE